MKIEWPKTLMRINMLRDQKTVDAFFDGLDLLGFPLNRQTWAEDCLERIHQLIEAENNFRRVMESINDETPQYGNGIEIVIHDDGSHDIIHSVLGR